MIVPGQSLDQRLSLVLLNLNKSSKYHYCEYKHTEIFRRTHIIWRANNISTTENVYDWDNSLLFAIVKAFKKWINKM